MIQIRIICNLCRSDIVHGAKTVDGAEFIAKQKGATSEDDTHVCADCQEKCEKVAA